MSVLGFQLRRGAWALLGALGLLLRRSWALLGALGALLGALEDFGAWALLGALGRSWAHSVQLLKRILMEPMLAMLTFSITLALKLLESVSRSSRRCRRSSLWHMGAPALSRPSSQSCSQSFIVAQASVSRNHSQHFCVSTTSIPNQRPIFRRGAPIRSRTASS